MMKADSILITWLLEESGLTKYSVSKATGIHQTTLANLEDGTSLIENLSFKNAAALTDLAMKKMEEEGIMKIWSRKGYTVEEREFNYNLHKLVIVVDGEDVAEIVPQDLDNMKDMMKELDNGEDVIGWENGNGETVRLPQYIVDTEDPKKVALNDFGLTQHINTYSRIEAEKHYNGNFDKGVTVLLSKLEYGEMELIKEREEE